ncbi:aminotransferase class I/II-fold pyridoxal phosphate-dependent enzyme [Candidatus Nasuia deltocephalinicola]|uniref:aminotransferase class I/II-fold pyridoxal phosphate-dependent enzyme n=1 Tax=Candidatus Nasuia deltocephalincola TaxID=1160784 RepID=UPI00216AC4C4|nr:aminotransferase class I/II-fold pyridoxal phosphate-dependent enzyme [Candidatus Nasuia deltocephalinicola]
MIKKLFKIKPYKKGYQPLINKNLKFNTNENPYHPDIKIIKNIIKEIKFLGNKLKFYPEDSSKLVIFQISKYYNIKKNKIFVGNGSDDVLSNIFLTFFKNKKLLYLIDITYSFYESFIKLYKINYKIIKLNKNFSVNLKFIKNNKNNIIINNPNAPTGKLIKYLKLKIISKKNKSLIVIDETYIDFSNLSLIKYLNKIKNVIINQTFSKSRALAGIRVGFAIASCYKLIGRMNLSKNCLNSYPVNIISQISIKNIFINNNYFKKIKKKIIKNKNYLIKKLKILNFITIKSYTNFIFTTNKKINVNKLIKFLNNKNIFIRKFEIPKIENYLRITVGKINESILMIKLIKKFIVKKL